MNSSVLLRSFAAVFVMGAFASVARSQLLTASTITGVENDAEYHASPALGNGTALTQTFTGFDSIDTVTFRFLAHGGTFSATNLTVYFSEWSGSNAIGSSAIFSGSLAINASSSGWTVADSFTSYFDASINLSSVSGLDNSKVYGLTVVGNGVSAGNFTLSSDLTNSYAGGAGFSNVGPVGSFSGLTSGGSAATYDFSFAAGVGGGASPVPEASTAAVLFAGVFVGGMMTRRRPRQSVVLDAAQA